MVFDRYLLRNLAFATMFTALCLTAVIMLSQSMRFMELIINSGASSAAYFTITMLALPRFFEVILPIALMIATVFIYNRMSSDSEVVVMRAAGVSPVRLARPAFAWAGVVAVILFVMAGWFGPLALSQMHTMRVSIKTEYSSLLLREGVFNQLGRDLTVYIRDRDAAGNLSGLMIHDSRGSNKSPITIIARRGVIVSDLQGEQVLVYEGSRQEYNPDTRSLSRLDFDRYALDLPDSGPVRQRFREPDERTLVELLNPDEDVREDPRRAREFMIEAHRRFISPFMALSFAGLSLCFMLLGTVNRRTGLTWRIVGAALMVIALQGLYLVFYNNARNSDLSLCLMYLVVFAPLLLSLYLISPRSEMWRIRGRRMMHRWRAQRMQRNQGEGAGP